jgi:hypothetical protein
MLTDLCFDKLNPTSETHKDKPKGERLREVSTHVHERPPPMKVILQLESAPSSIGEERLQDTNMCEYTPGK